MANHSRCWHRHRRQSCILSLHARALAKFRCVHAFRFFQASCLRFTWPPRPPTAVLPNIASPYAIARARRHAHVQAAHDGIGQRPPRCQRNALWTWQPIVRFSKVNASFLPSFKGRALACETLAFRGNRNFILYTRALCNTIGGTDAERNAAQHGLFPAAGFEKASKKG